MKHKNKRFKACENFVTALDAVKNFYVCTAFWKHVKQHKELAGYCENCGKCAYLKIKKGA